MMIQSVQPLSFLQVLLHFSTLLEAGCSPQIASPFTSNITTITNNITIMNTIDVIRIHRRELRLLLADDERLSIIAGGLLFCRCRV